MFHEQPRETNEDFARVKLCACFDCCVLKYVPLRDCAQCNKYGYTL